MPMKLRDLILLIAILTCRKPTVNVAERPPQIYDFYGFPDEMYQIKWTPAGSPEVASKVVDALRAEGLDCATDAKHGLDHGAWVPLHLMYPEADIPVLQLSIVDSSDPETHFKYDMILVIC